MMASSAPLLAQERASRDDDRVEYRIKRGDTLIALGRKYFGTADDWREVQRANRISDPRRIAPGDVIRIPSRLLKSTPAKLQVVNFTGVVRITVNGRADAARAGMDVGEGAAIQTGRNAFLSLASNGGSTVSLPSQSSVKLVRARRYLLTGGLDVLFAVNNGRAIFTPAPLGPADRFRVRTPVAVTAVRGTTFRIFHDEGSGDGAGDPIARSGTEVVEGEVQLAGEGAERGVPEGFGNVATASGLLPQEKLLPAVQLIEPGRVQTDAEVAFRISPMSGAAGYRTTLAADAGFIDVLAEQVSDEPLVSFADVPGGRFFVQSRAIAGSGLEGLSETYSFRRQRLGIEASVGATVLGNGFKFAWRPSGEGKVVYDFQLYPEGAKGLPLVAETGMEGTELTLTDLPPGVYFWQVSAIAMGDGEILRVDTDPQKLTVSP